MVRFRMALAVALVVAAVPITAAADAPAGRARHFTLALGDRAFWSGESSGDCGESCWSYEITVTEPGYHLRVGIDRPRLQDVWTAELFRPAGDRVGTFSPGTELYSAEISEIEPELGTYLVVVTAGDVVDRRFRMRAALEANNGGLPAGPVEVPPNLQPLPPWDFSFMLPVTNGSVGGPSRGVAVPGGRTACHPEEVVLYKAVRCLRMSFGVANTGLGPLALEVGPGGQLMDRPLIQHVWSADETSRRHNAGNAYYHHSHIHYHHDDAIGLDLLRVVDAEAGVLEAAGEHHRKGFAHRDELLREWTRFYPTWFKSGFGLLPGWGDYYEWDRPGNYIDFGLNGDGLYVLRITADPDGWLLETDPTDNVAYSLIRVVGDDVEHLESGRGTDPWDPCRTPLPLGPEFTDSFELGEPRPEYCAG